jgi:hypothetical protein
MKITKKFLEDMGICETGTTWFTNFCYDGISYSDTVAKVEETYQNGLSTKEEYLLYKQAAQMIKSDARAIDYWGDALYHNEFQFFLREFKKDYFLFNSLGEAEREIETIKNQFMSNPFSKINVLKWIPVEQDKFVSISIDSFEDIEDGYSYKLHDYRIGKFTEYSNKEELINEINQLSQIFWDTRCAPVKIQQKIEDSSENFFSWKEIKNVY